MKNIYLLLFCSFLLNCSSSQKEIQNKNSNTNLIRNISTENPLANEPVTGQITEYLDYSKMTINNKLPLSTTLKNMEMLAGKPDSIVKIDQAGDCTSCFQDENSQKVYFGSSVFENFKDSVTLGTMDFTKGRNLFLQNGNIKLDQNTTFEEIKILFPNSSKDIHVITTAGISGPIDSITIPVSAIPNSDNLWLLMFQKGKLIRIDHWRNCC